VQSLKSYKEFAVRCDLDVNTVNMMLHSVEGMAHIMKENEHLL